MKGDYTRETFRKEKHYSAVRMQQGRVQVDADWNEQSEISLYRDEATAKDIIGACGAPAGDEGGFQIGVTTDGKLTLSCGRIYVQGILCENDSDTDSIEYDAQPDIPEPLPDGAKFISSESAEDGTYFAYLDVWRRHITSLEDSDIRDVALGGTDTGTRLKTLWQVKLLRVSEDTDGDTIHCLSDADGWPITEPDGQLAAREGTADTENGPCIIEEDSGYRRLENQLYRVEVHESGNSLAEATFKWSRDNGFVAVKLLVDKTSGNTLHYASARSDATFGFAADQWVELTDDAHELMGVPGKLYSVSYVGDGMITVVDEGNLATDVAALGSNPKLRRWDGRLEESDLDAEGWTELEDGVEVGFKDGAFRSGDYWMIPARTSEPHIDWPLDEGGNPSFEYPYGIDHHYCKLAVIVRSGGNWQKVSDCREIFPAVTDLEALYYIGGDGQEARAGETLPLPLRVGVSNGSAPVEGATIHWKVESGGGSLSVTENATGTDGVATCAWTLGSNPDEVQEVVATLADADGSTTVHIPIRFHASIMTEEDGIKIMGVFTADANGTETALLNDSLVGLTRFTDSGSHLHISCSGQLWPGSFGRAPGAESSTGETVLRFPPKPTMVVTLYIPVRTGLYYQSLTGSDNLGNDRSLIGFTPLVLNGEATIPKNDPTTIYWGFRSEQVRSSVARIVEQLQKDGLAERVLATIRIEGNFIWEPTTEQTPSLYLDGEAFGRPRPGTSGLPDTVEINYDKGTGDNHKGGDFEMWFWLVPSQSQPELTLELELLENTVAGSVLAAGDAVVGATVTLSASSGLPSAERSTTTGVGGKFQFENVASGTYRVTARLDDRLAAQDVSVPGGGTPPPVGPTNPPTVSLDEVSGVGPVFRARLAELGVDHASALASMDPEALASSLGIPLQRARTLIDNAKNALGQ